jgi:hypothetical protein
MSMPTSWWGVGDSVREREEERFPKVNVES